MQCRQCGTDIADKAIICYRCGAATTDPVRRSVPVKRRRSPLLSFVALIILVLVALYQGYAWRTAANPEPWQMYVGFVAALAVIVLLVHLVTRR